MKNKIYNINVVLKVFILSVCLLNLTACSAKAKTVDTVETSHLAKHSDLTLNANTDTTLKSVSEKSVTYTKNGTEDSSTSQDSVKATAIRNVKTAKKRELIIDSIISNDSKLFGFRLYERSSDVGNEDTETRWYGSVNSSESSSGDRGTRTEILNTDFTHSDQIKSKFAKKDGFSNTMRNGEVTETRSRFLVMMTGLLSSWWFWIIVVIATLAAWLYSRRINPLTILKTLFNKFILKKNNTSQ